MLLPWICHTERSWMLTIALVTHVLKEPPVSMNPLTLRVFALRVPLVDCVRVSEIDF